MKKSPSKFFWVLLLPLLGLTGWRLRHGRHGIGPFGYREPVARSAMRYRWQIGGTAIVLVGYLRLRKSRNRNLR